MLRFHLITNDVSAFRLVDNLAQEIVVTCIIIPSNRQSSSKVQAVINESAHRGIPVSTHIFRKKFDTGMPGADIAVSWMYSQIIHSQDLRRYKLGAINMHGGKIPEYRGANVLQWAIINGEQELGVTWHSMVDAVDAGEIFAESTVPIAPDASAWEVRGLMLDKGVELFPEALSNLIAGISVRVPTLSEGDVWPVRRPEDGRIPPCLSERRLKDLIRALCPPWPRAFIDSDEGIIPIGGVCEEESSDTYQYKTIDGKLLFLQRAID
jgi:methionyl-tRNA formyltransferase